MRGLLVLVALVVLVVVALMALGFINIDQTRPGMVQAPSFKADVGLERRRLDHAGPCLVDVDETECHQRDDDQHDQGDQNQQPTHQTSSQNSLRQRNARWRGGLQGCIS